MPFNEWKSTIVDGGLFVVFVVLFGKFVWGEVENAFSGRNRRS